MFTSFGAVLSSVGFLEHGATESMMYLTSDLAETAMFDIVAINGTVVTVALAEGS
ncbi:hypothetical protein [Pontibacillus salipaludis]|uniref:Uncharacterized protein n=1 Tax=Pontibacillus salipaludis TaxID=1697394 RepID=A0ABQ1Q1E2_9BACI|nr:hypothetical protein [Pontibacillus salipaludis]GGD09949.1 hypothetical protein GCM10011389_16840 [Pontibacillus salipaludis]